MDYIVCVLDRMQRHRRLAVATSARFHGQGWLSSYFMIFSRLRGLD